MASLKDLLGDIKLTQEAHPNKSDLNEVTFLTADGTEHSIGDFLWDDDEGCWVINEGDD